MGKIKQITSIRVKRHYTREGLKKLHKYTNLYLPHHHLSGRTWMERFPSCLQNEKMKCQYWLTSSRKTAFYRKVIQPSYIQGSKHIWQEPGRTHIWQQSKRSNRQNNTSILRFVMVWNEPLICHAVFFFPWNFPTK